MQKRPLFVMVALAALFVVLNLSACASKATPPPATATPTTPPSLTSTPTLLAPTETPTQVAAVVDVPTGCSTYSLLPAPDPSAVEDFPAVQDGDWSQGLETASITIIEYSDFQ